MHSYKRTAVFLLLIFTASLPRAQILNPVSWTVETEKLSNKEYNLIFRANIEEPWHLYAMDIPGGGPIPTSFSFEPSPDYEVVGSVQTLTEAEVKYDPGFDMELGLISGEAVFGQKIALKADGARVRATVEFMSCDDERCLPPRQEELIISLGDRAGEPAGDTGKEGAAMDAPGAEGGSGIFAKEKESSETREAETISTSGAGSQNASSMWVFFLFAFLGGLAGILTPCVFPMIPMTVSFFMRGSENRTRAILKGMVFGLSVILIYTAIGVVVSLTGSGANFALTISTHWIPNIIFFILFMIFAISFLGMFELVLPSSWVNRADRHADKGGIAGSFFMALTLVLVSFSCTGPIVGAILVESAGGLAIKPTLGMFGFSLAFALPFTLLSIFPSWLKSLPKSGGWLNSVKVVLGLFVLAFGFKFLSNIDQAYHLNLMSREVYLGIWIIIAVILGFYLLGKIKFAHDSDLPYVSVPRLLLALASFVFALYLFTGLFGAPLRGVSGLIPPRTSQAFDLTEAPGSWSPADEDGSATFCGDAKYSEFLELPYGLEGYFDHEEGMACARELNKPVFLDFKGHTCANCKLVEAKVWSDPAVQKRLREDFVIIALYTDDKTRLPESERVTSSFDGKVKKTMGQKNLDLEISMFNTNTQPLYVVVDHDGNTLSGPAGTVLDVQEYIEFLDRGKENFRKGK